MKKLLLLAGLLLWFTACQQHEDELAPAELPDARLQKVLADYKTLLTGSEHGWKAVLVTGSGLEFHFLFTFTPEDRVIMAGDINESTATPQESSYRLKAMQQPALLFDTYSHLHILADPDPNKSGGQVGQGQSSDFEFRFDSASPETITLTGQYHGSKLVLTKATAAEKANYISNIIAQVSLWEQLNTFTTYFKRLVVNGKAYDIQVDKASRTLIFHYFEGETANIFSTKFSFSEQAIVLANPFTHAGLAISELKGVQFDAGNRRLQLTVNNQAAVIQEAQQPVKVDVQGARNFFNAGTGKNYWIAEAGFTVNGVPDAIKLRQIPGFYFLVLWPRYNTSNNVLYDLLGFVKINAEGTGLQLVYGPAAASRVSADGRLIYNYLGLLGEVPAGEEPAVTATRQIWTDPQGFYVVRTGAQSADLVSAKDGRAWLSVSQ